MTGTELATTLERGFAADLVDRHDRMSARKSLTIWIGLAILGWLGLIGGSLLIWG